MGAGCEGAGLKTLAKKVFLVSWALTARRRPRLRGVVCPRDGRARADRGAVELDELAGELVAVVAGAVDLNLGLDLGPNGVQSAEGVAL